ncbi:hypothetical protein [Saezia sanguinis]|uniref:hypothetical protein n=1 Tax=Saezia sanguinis TaxID=1965230 RepID=UPI003050487F
MSSESEEPIAQDKMPHVWLFLIWFFVCTILFWVYPDLHKDPVTIIGTVASFLTVYGVLFAIIELNRAKSSLELVQKETAKALNFATALITAHEISECQHLIQNIIVLIDEEKTVPLVNVVQVVKYYSQVFYEECKDEDSEYRNCHAMLESYAISLERNLNSQKSTPSRKTRQALITIVRQLGQLQGSTKELQE